MKFKRKYIKYIILILILLSGLIFTARFSFYFPDDTDFIRKLNAAPKPAHTEQHNVYSLLKEGSVIRSNVRLLKSYRTEISDLSKKKYLLRNPYVTDPHSFRFSTGRVGYWLNEKKSLLIPYNSTVTIKVNKKIQEGELHLSIINLPGKGKGSPDTTLIISVNNDKNGIIRKKIPPSDYKTLKHGRSPVNSDYPEIMKQNGWENLSINLSQKPDNLNSISFSIKTPGEKKRGLVVIGNPYLTFKASERRYNILYVIFDALSRNYVGIYNSSSRLTPCIDSLKNNAVVFDNFFSPATNTRIFMSSFFTGKLPMLTRHGIHYNFIPETEKQLFYKDKEIAVLPEVASANGYLSIQIGNGGFSHPFLSSGVDYGFDESFEFEKRPYDTTGLTYRLFSKLDKIAGTPFFIYAHFNTTHKPRITPLKYYFQGAINHPELLWRPNVTGSVQYADDIFKQIMNYLKNRELLDTTIVILTSDHGTLHNIKHYGENYNFNDFTKIPFIVILPEKLKKELKISTKRIAAYTTGLNLAPTLLDFLSIKPSSKFDGKSIKYLLSGPGKAGYTDEFIWSFNSFTISSVYKGRWKYILIEHDDKNTYRKRKYWRWGPGLQDASEQLYDLQNDPDELNNLAFSRQNILSVFRNKIKETVFQPELNILTFLPAKNVSKTAIIRVKNSSILRSFFPGKEKGNIISQSRDTLRVSCKPGNKPVYFVFETAKTRAQLSISSLENNRLTGKTRILAGSYNLPLFSNPITLKTTEDFIACLMHKKPDVQSLGKRDASLHFGRIDLRRWMKTEDLNSEKNLDENMKELLKSWGYIQ